MASLDSVNLDQVVDYRAEYTAVIQKYKITGDNLVGLCPFHQDRNDSFSVDLKTGKWHCFAEDEGGNFVTFWAKYQGIDTKEAYKEILASTASPRSTNGRPSQPTPAASAPTPWNGTASTSASRQTSSGTPAG